MITNCQKYEIRRLTRLLNGYPDLYDKVVNNYYMYARATIRSIRKYDYDESLKRAEMNEGIYKIGSDLRICSL